MSSLGDSWTRNCLTMGPSHGYTPSMSNRDGYERIVPRDAEGIEEMRARLAMELATTQWRKADR